MQIQQWYLSRRTTNISFWTLAYNDERYATSHELYRSNYTGSINFKSIWDPEFDPCTIYLDDNAPKKLFTHIQDTKLILTHNDKHYLFILDKNDHYQTYEPISISTKYLSKETLLLIEDNLTLSLLSQNELIRRSAEVCILS